LIFLNPDTDISLRRRAKSVLLEIQENTIAGHSGLKEFANHAGYKDGEQLLYNIFKHVAQDAIYRESCK
tara:strand:+ start:450 stop:656 length:207 start_codon:yes stop_codon:yes gene_type:complete